MYDPLTECRVSLNNIDKENKQFKPDVLHKLGLAQSCSQRRNLLVKDRKLMLREFIVNTLHLVILGSYPKRMMLSSIHATY